MLIRGKIEKLYNPKEKWEDVGEKSGKNEKVRERKQKGKIINTFVKRCAKFVSCTFLAI